MLGEGAGATNSLSLVLCWAVPSLAAEYYEDPRDVHATSALRQFFDPSPPTRNSTTTTATAAAAGAAAGATSRTAHSRNATHASTNGATASTTASTGTAIGSTAHASSSGIAASSSVSRGSTEADEEAQLRGQCVAGSYRSDRLKLIPRVVDSGSSRTAKKALQSVVEGSSSSWSGVLVGKRLRQRCFRVPERHYLEVRAAAMHIRNTYSLVLVMCAAHCSSAALQLWSCSRRTQHNSQCNILLIVLALRVADAILRQPPP
jgi:hypothetical protein